MPRKPKPKNTLSAGERAKLYETEQQEKQKRMRSQDVNASTEENRTVDPENATVNAASVSEMPQREKKSLPKPQKALVKVDFSIPVGNIKPLHGMCNGPVSYGADVSGIFREIGVPLVRFDCTDTAISAFAVDISRIFKDPYADPADPDSYDFGVTDKYVESALLTGAKVIFRLGESCDPLGNGRVRCRLSPDDLTRVCINIIKHYNDRFAGGYSYGIEYFELWNLTPSDDDDDRETDLEVYRRLANAVKLYDDGLKVGGLSFKGFDGAREFLRYCKRTRTPVDFVTVDIFGGDVEKIGSEAEKLSAFIKNAGMEETEIMVGKWSFVDERIAEGKDASRLLASNGEAWAGIRKQILASQPTIKGAAFAAALMLRLNSVQGVSSAFHFDAQPAVSPFCSITDRFGEPQKPFYAFKAYGDLYRAGRGVLCEVARVEGEAHSGIYSASALADSGEGYVMLASFDGCGTVDLRLENIPDDLYTADVYMLDGVKSMTLADSVALSGMKKRLVLNVSGYGAMLIKLY